MTDKNIIITSSKKERIGMEDYYKHTGNSKFGRRGIHKRIRLNAKNEIRKQMNV